MTKMFSDHGWPRVTETKESETVDKGGLLYFFPLISTSASANPVSIIEFCLAL